MAEHDSAQERTESATPRRQQEARNKGQVARSRELNTAAMTIAGAAGLLVFGPGMVEGIMRLMRASFRFDAERLGQLSLVQSLTDAVLAALVMLLPLFALLIVVAILSSIALGGFAFSSEALMPQLSRLNPANGLKRIFSWQGLAEMLKSLIKAVVIGAIAVWWLTDKAPEFLNLGEEPLAGGLLHGASLLGWSLLIVSCGMLLVAAVDVPFQLWQHAQQLRMTKQEVRDEFKETEGKPEVKRQIRKLQQEMARRRMMEEVPKADVVVTNPTHYAVALKYDSKKMSAPRVVAKGKGLVAAQIREIAGEHKVPLYSAPPLARAIYYSTDLDAEIPAGLYHAVAQVLAYIFQLREGMQVPPPPAELPIPPALQRDGQD